MSDLIRHLAILEQHLEQDKAALIRMVQAAIQCAVDVEREACAQIADARALDAYDESGTSRAHTIARQIRERGES